VVEALGFFRRLQLRNAYAVILYMRSIFVHQRLSVKIINYWHM